ncbi:hypothetical protein HPP92_014187 [Vanilla planifolia]|uniref:Uncharacterized protein n=1 Tax=Vanilla planifolia TaxID=51239 RepID=A0A835QUG6_VANPL|nr:hypothetical protein HPP92_014187 [Vanilla planifolia]
MVSKAVNSSFSSLSLITSVSSSIVIPKPSLSFFHFQHKTVRSSFPRLSTAILLVPAAAAGDDNDTSFFDDFDPNEIGPYDPPEKPEGYVPPPDFYELPPETDEEIAIAYEEIYGPAYSGESFLGNDVYVMDAKLQGSGLLDETPIEKVDDGFEESGAGEEGNKGGEGREEDIISGNCCGGRQAGASRSWAGEGKGDD